MDDDKRLQARRRNGPRDEGRNKHYALCDGLDCPCYQEGRDDVEATEPTGGDS